MIATPQDLAGWIGRPLCDPYDARVGTVEALRADPDTGAPAWLEVALADGSGRRAVPVVDAVPSGAAIRTPHPLEEILADRAQPPAPPPPLAVEPASPPAAGPAGEMAGALQRTHAALRATLERLAALRWRVEDAELVHDLALHHADVSAHAAAVRRRLAELDDVRAPLRDGLVKLRAWAHVKRRQVTQRSATADAHEAIALARDEMRAWRALDELARGHGDRATARLVARGYADAEALLYTVAASWPRFTELDRRRAGTSPFAPPPDLAELAPRT